MRYFFHIAYAGAVYSGWQKHPDGLGVQQVIEDCLSSIFKKTVWIVGCGRTDAHVHAGQFFFHLDTAVEWDFDLRFRLNKLLPNDITVFDIIPLNGLPHARFDAIQRQYDYFIHTTKDPFLSSLSAYYPVKNWDIFKMQQAASLLTMYDNYNAFCKTPNRNTHTVCKVAAAWVVINNQGNRVHFHIAANRFLGKMVRTIAGQLIEIGTGKLSVAAFEAHLINPQLLQTIKPAHPQGLYLSKITYPYLDIPLQSPLIKMLSI